MSASSTSSSSRTSPEITALEAAIAANPQDLDSCGVYADWLQERSDPMGNALALHVAILQEIDAAHQTELKIALKSALESEEIFGAIQSHLHRLELIWHLGVLERVRVRSSGAVTTSRTAERMPKAELVGRLLSLPVARFVSRVTVEGEWFVDFAKERLPEIIKEQGLRHIRSFTVEAPWPKRPPLAKNRVVLDPLNALPMLRSLSLDLPRIQFKDLSLPLLETLGLFGNAPVNDLESLKDANLPRVERVVLSISQVTDVAALAALPALHIVRIAGFQDRDSLVNRFHTALPKVDTFELNDVNSKTLARIQKDHPNLRIVMRRTMHLD